MCLLFLLRKLKALCVPPNIMYLSICGFLVSVGVSWNQSPMDPKGLLYHIDRIKEKKLIISVDAERAFDIIQHLFIIKALNKLRIEENYFNIINTMYKKPTANIVCNGEKLKAFPLRLGTRQGGVLSSLLFNMVLDVLARGVRQEKKKKDL